MASVSAEDLPGGHHMLHSLVVGTEGLGRTEEMPMNLIGGNHLMA